MIAVIFEVWPVENGAKTYFDLAAELRPLLEEIDGFISIERLENLTTKGKYLSLLFWRDEESIRTWRNLEEHRTTQEKGRRSVFAKYRIRVAPVVRDYGLDECNEVPEDSRAAHG